MFLHGSHHWILFFSPKSDFRRACRHSAAGSSQTGSNSQLLLNSNSVGIRRVLLLSPTGFNGSLHASQVCGAQVINLRKCRCLSYSTEEESSSARRILRFQKLYLFLYNLDGKASKLEVSVPGTEDELHRTPKFSSSSQLLLSPRWPQCPAAQFAQGVYSPWCKQGRGSKGSRALKFSAGPAKPKARRQSGTLKAVNVQLQSLKNPPCSQQILTITIHMFRYRVFTAIASTHILLQLDVW